MIFAYLRGRSPLRRALVLIDARRGPKDSDSKVLELLNKAAVSTLLVLTKFDEVPGHGRAAVLDAAQAEARRHTVALEQVIGTAAQTGEGIPALREHLYALTQS
jgi:GTP-binding protein